jgi:hypothetical protein
MSVSDVLRSSRFCRQEDSDFLETFIHGRNKSDQTLLHMVAIQVFPSPPSPPPSTLPLLMLIFHIFQSLILILLDHYLRIPDPHSQYGRIRIEDSLINADPDRKHCFKQFKMLTISTGTH